MDAALGGQGAGLTRTEDRARGVDWPTSGAGVAPSRAFKTAAVTDLPPTSSLFLPSSLPFSSLPPSLGVGFGCSYSTCFLSALSAVHSAQNPSLKPLSKDAGVRAQVSVGKDASGAVEVRLLRFPSFFASLRDE